MALPTLEQLFGAGATLTNGDLTIPAAALIASGVDNPATADALTLFGAVVKNAHSSYFATNNDASVMADIQYSAQAPAIRNNLFKTAFNFNCQFFGAYNVPTFDPDDV
jgi:hypothetical protein